MGATTKMKVTLVTAAVGLVVGGLLFNQPVPTEDRPDDDDEKLVVYSANWDLTVRGDVTFGPEGRTEKVRDVKPPFQRFSTARSGTRVIVDVELTRSVAKPEGFRCWVTTNDRVYEGRPVRGSACHVEATVD